MANTSSKVSRLLKRIGCRQSDFEFARHPSNPEEKVSNFCAEFVRVPLTFSALMLIHKQWLSSIPFENISVHSGEIIEVDVNKIFDKVVNQNRGGFCLEVNLLLQWLLNEVGFKTEILGGEVKSRITKLFDGTRNEHLVVQVDLDGKKYLADVGLGKHAFVAPLEMKLDVPQRVSNGTYRLVENKEYPHYWFVEKLLPDHSNTGEDKHLTVWTTMYRFSLEPRSTSDFLDACHYHQTNKKSLFVCKSLATLNVPGGVCIYRGFVFKELMVDSEGTEQVVHVQHLKEGEVKDILRDKFGIVVDKTSFVPCDDPIIAPKV